MKQFSGFELGVITVVAVALTAGCDHDDSSSRPTETYTGVVQIGEPLAGVTVFLDLDNNNVFTGNDRKTVTDETGHYTLAWENYGEAFGVPHSIVAIVLPETIRVGVIGPDAAVGYALHLRAPVGELVEDGIEDNVISPLSTLVVGQLGYEPTLTIEDAQAEVVDMLRASELPLTGEPIDLLADYLASPDRESLRNVSGAIAATLSTAVTIINTKQDTIDSNRATYFDPITVALITQLTNIANGTYNFSLLPGDLQLDIELNPASYRDYFINTQALVDQLKELLIAAAVDFAADLLEYVATEFVQQFQDRVTEYVAGELIGFLLPI